jgi:squalene cyclase
MHKQLTRDLFKFYATTTGLEYSRIAQKVKISLRTAFYWRKVLGLPARKRGRK